MGEVTANTIWPTSTSISAATKSLIELLFNLTDLNTPEAGPRLAEEVFAEDGEFVSAVNTTKGSAGTCLHFINLPTQFSPDFVENISLDVRD